MIDLLLEDFEAPLAREGVPVRRFEVLIESERARIDSVRPATAGAAPAVGFVRLDEQVNRTCALALTDAGPLLSLGDGFLLVGSDFAQAGIEVDDWGVVRQVTVTSPGWAAPFRRRYAVPLQKEFFADSTVREFADFFGYLAAQWQAGFPELAHFVDRERRIHSGF